MLKIVSFISAMALVSSAFAGDNLINTEDAIPSPWAIEVSGTAQHFNPPKNKQHSWNQRNWGFGIQYDVPVEAGTSWGRVYSVGTMSDSLGVGGAYLGVTELKDLFAIKSVKVQAGAGLFLLYRTFAWEGRHRWAPAPLPVIHVEDQKTGFGLNIILAPTLSFSQGLELPGFVFFQATKRFKHCCFEF
jgi:hypothetical protein